MRNPHYLTRNEGAEYPRDVIVVDTETTESPQADGTIGHVLAFGWAFYARRVRGDEWEAQSWHRFDTRADFWRWATRRARSRGRLTVYCHNAEFDAQVLDAFGELRKRSWRVVSACLEGPPTIIRWRRGSRTIQWLDTLNIWQLPLKVLGKRVGLAKRRMPRGWDDRAKGDAYCRRDVEIVWRALTEWWRFLRDHDLGTAAPTLAGQAMSAYRHRFMTHSIFIDNNEHALELARSAYLGGRCECFRLGLISEPGVTLDVNSMYPYVMRELRAPAKLLTVRTMATLADLARYVEHYAVVAEVDLRTDEPAYPHVIDGRLCFPVGEFRQSLATPELRYAMERGHVRNVRRVAVYEAAELFKSFVDWGWSMRTAAASSRDELSIWQAKRLVNAFYGKWGQRGRQWEIVGKAHDVKVQSLTSFDVDTGQWRNVRQLGDALQELRDKGESLNSHPAIAAHVTSAARLHLWKLMTTAGLEHVWYCDTDSIKGARIIVKKLARHIDKHQLGALKLEERHRWLQLHGCKDYETPQHTRRKGVRANAKSADGVAFTQLQWYGWAGSIARGRLDMPLMEHTVKVLSRDYSKGLVAPDGKVSPLILAAGRSQGSQAASAAGSRALGSPPASVAPAPS